MRAKRMYSRSRRHTQLIQLHSLVRKMKRLIELAFSKVKTFLKANDTTLQATHAPHVLLRRTT